LISEKNDSSIYCIISITSHLFSAMIKTKQFITLLHSVQLDIRKFKKFYYILQSLKSRI